MLSWIPIAGMVFLGFVGVLVNRGLPGILGSLQVLSVGLILGFVVAGGLTEKEVVAESDALLVLLAAATQIVVGLALSVRFFYLRRNVRIEELRQLKH